MESLLRLSASVDTRVALVVYLALLDLWSIGLLFRSDGSRREKVLWSGVILLCPVVGCVLWFVLGPKPFRRVRRGRPREGASRG